MDIVNGSQVGTTSLVKSSKNVLKNRILVVSVLAGLVIAAFLIFLFLTKRDIDAVVKRLKGELSSA